MVKKMKAYKSILIFLSLLCLTPMIALMYVMILDHDAIASAKEIITSVMLFIGGIMIVVCLQVIDDYWR